MSKAFLYLFALLGCAQAIRYRFTTYTRVNDNLLIFHNVAQGIDAQVDFGNIAGSPNVYVDTYDVPKTSTGSAEALQVRLEGVPQGGKEFVEVNVTFYEAALGTSHAYSDNFEVCFVDLDGTADTNERGSAEIAQIFSPAWTNWEVEQDTSLTVTEFPGFLEFKGAYNAESGIDTTATNAVGCAYFNAQDHVKMRIGYARSANSANLYRLFSINMFDAIVYDEAASSVNELPNLACGYATKDNVVYKCRGADCRVSTISNRANFEPIVLTDLPSGLNWAKAPTQFYTNDGFWVAEGGDLKFTNGTRVSRFQCECECADNAY